MKYYPGMYRILNSYFAITATTNYVLNVLNGFDMCVDFMGPWQISICKYKKINIVW